ncbi:type II secretion system protein [bacterium]|nr:type II secretion system protein [bacterium]
MPLRGFTLAEVLITLGIIGVVAALTIPTLMQKIDNRETISKFKKFASVFSQALALSVAENGTVDKWNINLDTQTCPQDLANRLKPYLNLSVDIGCSPSDYVADEVKFLNGNIYAGNNYNDYVGYYKMLLSDGSLIWFRGNISCSHSDLDTPNVCAIFWIDVNGKKSPNQIGKDIFLLLMQKDKILPNKADDCSLDDKGYGCAAYVLKNDSMDYLKN